jgi:DNA-binding transcriptional ArsR family regulator
MFQKLHPTLSVLYLRALKGAPLACLFFLGEQPQPMTVAQLSQLTGYSRRTVREALALLVELRLAARGRPQGRVRTYRLLPRDRAGPLASHAGPARR